MPIEKIVLDTVETGIPLAWDAVKMPARGIHWLGNALWNRVPAVGGIKRATENAWENSQHKTACKVAATAAAGVTAAIAAPLALGLSTPLIAGATLLAGTAVASNAAAIGVATLAGGVASAATLMATHPGQHVHFKVPTRASLELESVGNDVEEQVTPQTALDAIGSKSEVFVRKHPSKLSVNRPEKTVVNNNSDPLAEFNLAEQQEKTNIQRDQLIRNVSAYTSAYFIFSNRLGLKMQSDSGVDILTQITAIATTADEADGTYPNLWDTCMECLNNNGIELTLLQWIRAKFWYFLSDTIGIIPNACKEMGEKILNHLRGGVKHEQHKIGIAKIIERADSFLEKYKGATKSYADAGQAGFPPIMGNIADYHKQCIDRLGGEGALEIAERNRAPGEDLGKKMMEQLCQEFVSTIVNDPDLFPSIPLFRSLQKFTLLGIRFGIFFDVAEWFLGGVVNWIWKKLVNAYAPAAIQTIIQGGIDQAMPGKYGFKIAVARALQKQVEELKASIDTGIPSQPLRFPENKQLNDLITKLMETLELKSCNGDAEALRKKFRELENPSEEAKKMSTHLKDAVIKGARLLILHYTQKPEAIEELLETLFRLSSEPFQAGARIQTEAESDDAIETLKESVRKLIKQEVKEVADEEIRGESPAVVGVFLQGPDANALNPEGQLIDPPYKGLFYEQKEAAAKTALVLRGLAIKMSRNLFGDREKSIQTPPRSTRSVAEAQDKVDDATQALIAPQAQLNAAGNAATAMEKFNLRIAKKALKAAKFELQVAKAQDKVNATVEEINAQKHQIKAAGLAATAQEKYDLKIAENILLETRLELEIADESRKLTKEIIRLMQLAMAAKEEGAAADTPEIKAKAKSKLKQARAQLELAEQASDPKLIEAAVRFNPLKKETIESSKEHLLKNLDNYMKVIKEFTEHVKSLNIDLYSDKVRRPFNRAFNPIYQELLSLTNELIVLQPLEKSYEKSKRLTDLFTAIEKTVNSNSPPHKHLNDFRTQRKKLIDAGKEFDEYERDIAENETPFDAAICALEHISTQYAVQEGIFNQIKKLGPTDKLSHAILAHPKKWVKEIREKIPLEDQAELFYLISHLQKNAASLPMPDLAPDHAAVTAKFNEIFQKYKNLTKEQFDLGATKHQEIAIWAKERKTVALARRDQLYLDLQNKFATLREKTEELYYKVVTTKLEIPADLNLAALLPSASIEEKVQEIVDKIITLTNSGYDLITSPQLTEGTARIAMRLLMDEIQ